MVYPARQRGAVLLKVYIYIYEFVIATVNGSTPDRIWCVLTRRERRGEVKVGVRVCAPPTPMT